MLACHKRNQKITSEACIWSLVRFGVNRKENARREAPGVGAATECRAETIAGAQNRGTWSSPYPALTPLHYWISLTPLPSLPLFQRSTRPGMGKTLAKTRHRQSGTLTSTNTITRREAEDTGPNLKAPGRRWKIKSRKNHRHVNWQLIPRYSQTSHSIRSRESTDLLTTGVRLQFPQKRALTESGEANECVSDRKRRWHTQSLEIGELWRRKWWCSCGENRGYGSGTHF